jgi:hypothetical protein
MNDIYLIVLVGYLFNFLSIGIYTIWFGVISWETLNTTKGILKAEKYKRLSEYNLFTMFRLFIPFLCSFKVYEYILTYYIIRDNKINGVYNCFDILLEVDYKLTEKQD